ncbi:hypothetical protein [Pseudomonas sp. SLFW]|uniref:hypothetical protein n=1 Tax=Pseudomonas sp. SLFW TaxID=2683259 RepID=UPI0014133C27|nr:hypothetical protein [Pseudomonas sp. SLFW]NBB09725.1 hypothetical protein [Pseudomonas sp. SLFW]
MTPDNSAWIAVSISALTLLNLAFLMYSAYWKLPLAERHLADSLIVSSTKSVWKGNGPVARLNRLSAIALVFTMRGLLERRGLVQHDIVNDVPLSLRIWTAGPILSSCLMLVTAVGYWFLEQI